MPEYFPTLIFFYGWKIPSKLCVHILIAIWRNFYSKFVYVYLQLPIWRCSKFIKFLNLIFWRIEKSVKTFYTLSFSNLTEILKEFSKTKNPKLLTTWKFREKAIYTILLQFDGIFRQSFKRLFYACNLTRFVEVKNPEFFDRLKIPWKSHFPIWRNFKNLRRFHLLASIPLKLVSFWDLPFSKDFSQML